MPSNVVRGLELVKYPDISGKEGPYNNFFACFGDSWNDVGDKWGNSLPEYLKRLFNEYRINALIANNSKAGRTLRELSNKRKKYLNFYLNHQKFDGILISIGGNDFLDYAIKPAPGTGILKNMYGNPNVSDGAKCINFEEIRRLKKYYLNPGFDSIYNLIRNSKENVDTPIFLNCYDIPTVGKTPIKILFLNISGPWLSKAYVKNNIPEKVWPDLTKNLFREVEKTIKDWTVGKEKVYAVPTLGTLKRGDPDDGDWANEIHPNERGWKKLARVWGHEISEKTDGLPKIPRIEQ